VFEKFLFSRVAVVLSIALVVTTASLSPAESANTCTIEGTEGADYIVALTAQMSSVAEAEMMSSMAVTEMTQFLEGMAMTSSMVGMVMTPSLGRLVPTR